MDDIMISLLYCVDELEFIGENVHLNRDKGCTQMTNMGPAH